MNDKKYTPGPWKSDKRPTSYPDLPSAYVVWKEGQRIGTAAIKENAILFSCAPELLEALEELVNHLKDGCYCGEVFPDGHPMLTAIDVIFKAKGESQ